MFLKPIKRVWHRLAFKLTLWYAIIFITSLLGSVFTFYILATNDIQERADQGLLEDLYEVSATLALMGPDSAHKAINIEAESDGVDKIFLRLLDAEGKVVAASNMKSWNTVEINKSVLHRVSAGVPHIFETQAVPGKRHKTRVVYGTIGSGRILQIGVSSEEEAHFFSTFNAVMVPIMIFLILFSAVIGWFMATRALSGVEAVTKAALDISKGDFSRRVQLKSKSDEIELLAKAFNRMLDRINDLMKGLKEVTDNIAHDLKTPLTRMRVAAETELVKVTGSNGSQEFAAGTIEECDNLLQMINTMLMISKEESGVSEREKKNVDMSQIIQEAFELFSPIAEEKGLSLSNRVPDNVQINGDFHGLQRMVINLLENAIKYTPAGGSVTISSDIEDDHIQFTFHDTGIGISTEDLPHIFKRLYRCDGSRSQQGFGLGLSLALAVVQAHQGDITVKSQQGKGSIFTVVLPR